MLPAIRMTVAWSALCVGLGHTELSLTTTELARLRADRVLGRRTS